MAVTVTPQNTLSGTSVSGVLDLGTQAYGSADPTLLAVLAIGHKSDSSPTSVTVGGVSAVKMAEAINTTATPDIRSSIWVARIGSLGSTNLNTTINCSGAIEFGVKIWAVRGANAASASDSDAVTGASATIATSAVTVPTNGAAVFSWANQTAGTACVWTNATGDSDQALAAARTSSARTTTAGTNTITADGATANQALCGVAFAPITALTPGLHTNTQVWPLAAAEAAYLPSRTSGNDTVNTNSHVIALPGGAGANAGKRILIHFNMQEGSGAPSITSGWTQLINSFSAANGCGLWYRDCDGSEGASVTITTITSNKGCWIVETFASGKFDPAYAPVAAGGTTSSTTATPNPPNLAASWSSDPSTIFFALVPGGTGTPSVVNSYPTNYNYNQAVIGGGSLISFSYSCERPLLGATDDPAAYQMATAQAFRFATIAVKLPSGALATAKIITATVAQPSLHTNAQTFYGPKIKAKIAAPSLTNAQSFYAPTIKAQIAAPSHTNDQAFYAPTVSAAAGGGLIQPPLFTNVNTFYGPTLSAKLAASLHTNAQAFYAPKIVATLKPSLHTNSQTFYGPKLAAKLAAPYLVNTQQFFGPRIGEKIVAPPLHTNVQSFFAPKIAARLKPSLFTNAQTFYTPKLARTLKQSALFTNAQTFYTPLSAKPPMTTLVQSARHDNLQIWNRQSLDFGIAWGASYENTSLLSSHTVPLPTTRAGNRILVFCEPTPATTMTVPGWTIVDATSEAGTSEQCWWRDCDGTSADNFVAACSPTAKMRALVAVIPAGGYDPGVGPSSTNVWPSGTSTTPDPPAFSSAPFSGSSIAVFAWMGAGFTSAWSLSSNPSGYTAGDNFGGKSSAPTMRGVAVATKKIATSVAENPGTFTISTSNAWFAETLAVKVRGRVSLSQSSRFNNSQTFYAPTVNVSGAVTPRPSLHTNAQQFFTAKIRSGISAPFFANAQGFFAPSIKSRVSLAARFNNAQVFYAPSVAVAQPGFVQPTLHVNAQVFYGGGLMFGAPPVIPQPPRVSPLGPFVWSEGIREGRKKKRREPVVWKIKNAEDIPDQAPPWEPVVVTAELARQRMAAQRAGDAYLGKLKKRVEREKRERDIEDAIVAATVMALLEED